jgi:chitinase
MFDHSITLHRYAQVDPKKINMGLARYGRGFTVKDKQCMNLGCEFLGGNKAGPCTNTESTLSNQEIHELIKEKGLVPEFVKDHGVKVIKYDDQWIAYDDYETFELKKEYANDRCFGGIFVWELTQAGKGRYVTAL